MLGNSTLSRIIIDLLLPRTCLECGCEGSLFCVDCGGEVAMSPIVLEDGHISSLSYSDHRCAELLHAWKYSFDSSARDILLYAIHAQAAELRAHVEKLGITHIVPIPLHRRRACERGFNQATEIAEVLSESVDIPVLHALMRPEYSKQQMKKSKEERAESVQNLFRETVPMGEGSVALIVDDVRSTGATLRAAADSLSCPSHTYTLFANE